MRPHTVAIEVDDEGVTVVDTLTNVVDRIDARWVVVAETARPEGLSADLNRAGIGHHAIGDCVAARRASLAFYEGRKLGLAL